MSKKMFLSPTIGNDLLFDTYLGDLGLSLFKLLSSYNGLGLRVFRDVDGDVLDFGYSGATVNFSSILSFVGSGSGFINRIYSPVGSNYAFQDNPANMPRIVNSGVLEVNPLTGKPAMYFDGVNDFLDLLTPEIVTNDFSVFGYGKRFASGSMFAPILNGTPGCSLMQFADNNHYLINSSGYNVSNSADTSSSSVLLEGHSTSSSREIYKNQSLISTSPAGGSFENTFTRIGGPYAGTYTKGHLSEIVLYKTNQNSNRIAIGNDIILRNS